MIRYYQITANDFGNLTLRRRECTSICWLNVFFDAMIFAYIWDMPIGGEKQKAQRLLPESKELFSTYQVECLLEEKNTHLWCFYNVQKAMIYYWRLIWVLIHMSMLWQTLWKKRWDTQRIIYARNHLLIIPFLSVSPSLLFSRHVRRKKNKEILAMLIIYNATTRKRSSFFFWR